MVCEKIFRESGKSAKTNCRAQNHTDIVYYTMGKTRSKTVPLESVTFCQLTIQGLIRRVIRHGRNSEKRENHICSAPLECFFVSNLSRNRSRKIKKFEFWNNEKTVKTVKSTNLKTCFNLINFLIWECQSFNSKKIFCSFSMESNICLINLKVQKIILLI